jgi:hypothetical protein
MRVRLSAAIAVVLLVIAMIVMVLTHTPAFSVSGNLTSALRPGTSAPIDLTLTNPHSYPMTVTAVAVRISAVTVATTGKPSSCSTSNFVVREPVKVLPITLAAHSSVSLSNKNFPRSSWPQITMLKTNVSQNECKNVSLQISYLANGAFWGKP